ncbi:putative UDP-glucose flavonoid 3-O-glucosyltransferase 3 [Sesamum alatum]|uniref:Glycosyltransferase n=1 Tax=Sesamum alatum TaxID=300844 RepID=A0AAE1YVM3_9LAMI|nr:putative UDP-glucose flavonoid 3-O-glucosyltransferase 3 [Sesamum alatum]
METKKVELVFVPSPGLSHLVSTVEMAKLLLDRYGRLSITVLIMKLPTDRAVDSYTKNISSDTRLRFINLPTQDDASLFKMFDFIDNQIIHIRDIVSNLIKQPSLPGSQLAGLVLDMFCTKFIPVADEFHLPAYAYFTSGAAALGLFYHLVSLRFEQNQDLAKYKSSDVELSVPCFSNPVPAKVLPAVLVNEGPMSTVFLSYFKRLTETRGIMVNTFYELESYAIESLQADSKKPKVYPVGPILNSSHDQSFDEDIKKWLDDQPENSVVFLCFGTMGSFEEAQVKEIALALENSGSRFLWSLRKPGQKGVIQLPTEFENFNEVLPEGFLERTEGIGKVIGWAPQVAALSHPAVGGFVSHCGWNSTLESVWFGVPMATFPLYAEQQVNAFQLVKELGLAEAIRIDYKKDFKGERPPEIVGAEEIETAIRRLMAEEGGSGVRQKMKEMKNKGRMALMEGGSSYNAQSLFIEEVIRHIA